MVLYSRLFSGGGMQDEVLDGLAELLYVVLIHHFLYHTPLP